MAAQECVSRINTIYGLPLSCILLYSEWNESRSLNIAYNGIHIFLFSFLGEILNKESCFIVALTILEVENFI
jgi:hypothetical protein